MSRPPRRPSLPWLRGRLPTSLLVFLFAAAILERQPAAAVAAGLGVLACLVMRPWRHTGARALGPLLLAAVALASSGGLRLAAAAGAATLLLWPVATRRRRRRPAAPARRCSVDPATGLSTAVRLRPVLAQAAAEALAEHRPLSVLYVRLHHYADARDFLGHERSEALVAAVARRLLRAAPPGARGFRVAPDAFVLLLPDTPLAEARALAPRLARAVSAHLVAGRRQTVSCGAASFPTVRDLGALLAAAVDDAVLPPEAARPAPALALVASR